MSTQEAQEMVAILEVDPVQGKGTFEWSLTLYQHQGKCYISWDTTAPFRAQQGKLCLYSDSIPGDPNDRIVAWTWDDADKKPFNTGQLWGSGWCAAYIAQKSPNGSYTYVATTDVTK